MAGFHGKGFIKQDFAAFREIQIDKDLLNNVIGIFEAQHSNFIEFMAKDGNIDEFASVSWDLASRLEDLLNISLRGDYFGRALAHPFMVAPGKHTRVGRKDYLRPVRARIAEGWAGIVLKTVVGDEPSGKCNAADNRGDVYWPVLKKVDAEQFISAERGTKLDVDAYTSDFLTPALELGKCARSVVVPSILCQVPLKNYEEEWHSTLERVHAASSILEADLSPTIIGSISSWDQKEQIMENLDVLKDHVVSLVRHHGKKFPRGELVQKINGQNRDVFPWIVEELKRALPGAGQANFTTFNRQFASLVLPWIPARVRSAVGGPAIFYHNLHVLDKLFTKEDNAKRVKISYTGGVDTGIKAAWVFMLTNARSIQVATSLMRQGGFNALARILGGFALFLSWLGEKLDKEAGLDMHTPEKLNLLFHREEMKDLGGKILEFHPRPRVAAVDPDICDANCKTGSLIASGFECPASISCPACAFELKERGDHQHVNKEICIGCGNCGETCAKGAIRFHPL